MNRDYDTELEKMAHLRWLPYIGKNYDATHHKVLFVGESHYFDPKNENTNFERREFTRMIVDEMAICSFQYGSPFFNNISALFNYSDRISLWNNTSFYNFIQRPMNKGDKVLQGIIERPTNVDFADGWKTFFDVIKNMKPDYCIFFGNTSANYFNKACHINKIEHKTIIREEKINGSYLKKSEVLIDNHTTELIFIKHPSSYFSVIQWRELLVDKYPSIKSSLLSIIS